jgi:hypothetical protein
MGCLCRKSSCPECVGDQREEQHKLKPDPIEAREPTDETRKTSGEEPYPRRPERLLRWFAVDHLPPNLQIVSRQFRDLAYAVVDQIPASPERTVALRKLLEARGAAVRAVILP